MTKVEFLELVKQFDMTPGMKSPAGQLAFARILVNVPPEIKDQLYDYLQGVYGPLPPSEYMTDYGPLITVEQIEQWCGLPTHILEEAIRELQENEPEAVGGQDCVHRIQ